jgi:hypothetical protein
MSDTSNVERSFWRTGGIQNEEHLFEGDLHRIDGPADIYYSEDGSLEEAWYYRHGYVHREDGPAEIYYNAEGLITSVDFWIEGEQLSFWDFYDQSSTDVQKVLLRDWLCYV